MSVLVKVIKKHIVWMVLSYLLFVFLAYNLVITPQNRDIQKYREEKTHIEYNYRKITAAPEFIRSLDKAVADAEAKAENFAWLERGDVDAGLLFYNYIYDMARKSALDLLSVSSAARPSLARGAAKEPAYYTWNVRLAGAFPDMLYMIDEIENDRRFVIVEEIKIARGRGTESRILYDLVCSGLKGTPR